MLFEIILLLCAIPTGFLISWMARDELIQGRKWFIALIGVSAIAGIALFSLKLNAEGFTCIFVAIVSGVSYWKSFDKKWTKRKNL